LTVKKHGWKLKVDTNSWC